jgi:hypothetical protein
MVEVSSFLLIIVGLSMIGGIIFGLYYTTIVSFIFDLKKRRKNSSTNFTTTREQENIQKLENVLKTKPDLIKKNSELMEDELKIYQFEKDLATHAIEKILLAAKNKAIDSFEQDRLLLKYKDQLKKLNGKMEKIQSEIDVTKLINLRNDLAFLIDNKISDIDEKIKEINLKIGTNYNIKDILLNSTRKNTSYDDDDSKKNINNNSSFIDTEGTIGEADNLNYRELTTYKNSPTQKRKEMIIESERKKIDDLKDQVLVALDRLDKTGDIKIEVNDDLDTKKFTENKTFMDKDPLDKNQKKQEINEEEKEEKENEEYSSIENDKKSSNTVIKEYKSNFPTIFSSLRKFPNDNVMTTKRTFDPSLSKNSEEGGLNYGNSNPNTVNESNSLRELEIEKNNNDNYNKKTPLSNILNQASPNLDHSIKSKYDNKNDLSKDQSPKDKSAASLGHHPHLNKNDNRNNRFKFPWAFIFSKNRQEKKEEAEKGKHINGEERYFGIHEERKDPLKNIVNKKKVINRK